MDNSKVIHKLLTEKKAKKKVIHIIHNITTSYPQSYQQTKYMKKQGKYDLSTEKKHTNNNNNLILYKKKKEKKLIDKTKKT